MGEDEGAGLARIQEAGSMNQRAGPVAYQRAGPVAYQRAGPVAYQRDAILRVVLPHGKTTTDLHCDADYHHPPWELNWSGRGLMGCICTL